MTARCESVLVTLLSVARKHQRYYCWVSQKRILELMKLYQKFGISRRTLNRDLRWLEDNGYISRLRRIRVDNQGKLVFCSTLYKFKGKLFNWLSSIGNRVKRLFTWFRVPKLAHYQLSQKAASSLVGAPASEGVVFTDRSGRAFKYDPSTGEVTER